MVNMPIAHFASVNGPFWNKTIEGRSRPEEVKFHSQGRTQDFFHLNPRSNKWDFNIFRKVNL